MALSINHNLMAMNTARNLNSAYGNIATSTRRLSSGLRVGTAADDAAGLAIREMMRADISSINQGVRNANDAISLIQVADGALSIIDEKLVRMKELATQAATGTYTSDQRMIINSEFQAMASEINRIANATNFNGIKLINSINPDVNPMSVQWWNKINTGGFGTASNNSTEALQEYKGNLFAGTQNNNGAQVWEYNGNLWSQSATNGFGVAANVAVFDFEIHSSELYAATNNPTLGAQIWKSNGSAWTQANISGFGDVNNRGVQQLQEYKGNLFAGTVNVSSGTEVWAYDGLSWSNVSAGGFGNPDNLSTLSMTTFRGELYAGTVNSVSGSEVWKYDGSAWQKVGAGGLGNVNNVQIQSLVSYNDRL